jgi:hypothetical protein
VSRLEALESVEVQLQVCGRHATSLKEDVMVYLINMAISEARRNCALLRDKTAKTPSSKSVQNSICC